MINYYQRIRDLREDADKTQAEIAELLGTTFQYYSTYENGKRQMPIDRYIKLAEYYNVSLDYLAGLIDTKIKLDERKTKCNVPDNKQITPPYDKNSHYKQ